MKFTGSLLTLCLLFLIAPAAMAQEKGVDTQSQKVREDGSSRSAGVNGGKTDVGTSKSGINFGGGKTPEVRHLPNPYRVTSRRDALLKAITDLMRDRKLIVDDAASRPDEGIIVAQPYTFIKGAVITESELSRFARVETSDARGWTRARYTITVEVQPIDGMSANVSVNAKIEGRTDGVTGAEWITLPSNGTAEQEFLVALLEGMGLRARQRPYGDGPPTAKLYVDLVPKISWNSWKY